MERDGLIHVTDDRQLALSETGRALATRVMRKHRLAECLLVDVIKLPWEEVHIEACRWEHVISESVERRLFELLGRPERCPHGNIIPGLDELMAGPGESAPGDAPDQAMTDAASGDGVHAVVSRISEQIQSDLVLMLKLKRAGIQPGREVLLGSVKGGVRVTSANGGADVTTELESQVASHVFVSRESGQESSQ
jgi:DtxR family Mn-dependent transcriptional regulator